MTLSILVYLPGIDKAVRTETQANEETVSEFQTRILDRWKSAASRLEITIPNNPDITKTFYRA